MASGLTAGHPSHPAAHALLHDEPIILYETLNRMVEVLGSTKRAFWPGTSFGRTVAQESPQPYGAASIPRPLQAFTTSAKNLADTFEPQLHASGLVSYALKSSENHNFSTVSDHASFSFGDGSVDGPFSVGMWIFMHEAVGTKRTLFGKYDTSGALREWMFGFDASGKLDLELYDESADATEIGTGATALVPFIWQFVVATYDGGETAPDVHLYINGTDSLSGGATTETATYTAMEDTATVLMIGADNNNVSPSNVYSGRLALPFVTGKELTQANVTALYDDGQKLIGLA